jgi:hypothetical protein
MTTGEIPSFESERLSTKNACQKIWSHPSREQIAVPNWKLYWQGISDILY